MKSVVISVGESSVTLVAVSVAAISSRGRLAADDATAFKPLLFPVTLRLPAVVSRGSGSSPRTTFGVDAIGIGTLASFEGLAAPCTVSGITERERITATAITTKTIAAIATKHGVIHALVNSAGITGPTGIITENISTEDFRKILEINLFGSIWLTQAVLPLMKEQKYGRILHLASIAGKEGNPGMSPYNVSKAGLIGYVKGVAKEVAPYGVTINAIAPAVIRTPLNANTTEDTMKYMIARIPMGRVGEASEVAELIAFAVSKGASFTTGFTFDISGGRATY